MEENECDLKVQDESQVETEKSSGMPPKTWLADSILVTIFCCLPFGIAGIVNASKIESAFYAGDEALAEEYSKKAKKWVLWSFWLGIPLDILIVIRSFMVY